MQQKHKDQAGLSHVILPIFILAIVLAVAGFAFTKINKGDDPKSSSNNQANAGPDFAGMSGSCKPIDEHQWYRSDGTLSVDPQNPSNVYVFIEKRGFFKSTDAGETWQYKSKGIKGFNAPDLYKGRPCYVEFRTMAIDPTNPQRILLGALGDFDDIKSQLNQAGGMLETLDGGESWHQLLKPGMNAYVHDIAIDPSNPQTIYYVTSSQKPANRSTSLNTKGLVYKTSDGGKNWKELPTGLIKNAGGQQIFIDSKDPKRLMFSTIAFNFNAQGKRETTTETLGMLSTEDAGESWKSIKSLPLADSNLSDTFGSSINFNNLYGVAFSDQGARSYYTTDGAQTFKKAGFPMDIVAYDPGDTSGNTLFGYSWQSGGKTMYKSSNAGATWQPTGTLPAEITKVQDPKLRISKIVIDPKNSKNIYMAGSSAYVWKSTDSGQTWKATLSIDRIP